MNPHLSIEPSLDLETLPWASVDAIGLPTRSFGRPVAWRPDYAPRPVFICTSQLPGDNDLQVFGIRYDFQHRTEPPPDTGFFLRYVVIESTESESRTHVLAQHRSPTYQSLEETGDRMIASDLKKRDLKKLCLREAPRWKPGSAVWPLLSGTPMQFVDQFALPENEVTRDWLTFNETVFLFSLQHEDSSFFKITTQETLFQSAEDHYQEEACRMKKNG